jgi:hypothetical protein
MGIRYCMREVWKVSKVGFIQRRREFNSTLFFADKRTLTKVNFIQNTFFKKESTYEEKSLQSFVYPTYILQICAMSERPGE